MNGQWAVALWDSERRALVLARDPFGVRPLYVTEYEGRLYFASEVKAIFAAAPAVPRRFDALGLDQLLTFWTPVAPRTIFSGVEEVEPGTIRTYTMDTVTRASSWSPSYPEASAEGFSESLETAAQVVREALETATSLRMLRSDVPVGCYLSGGLDSSIISALGLRASGARFSTYSLRFEDAEYDETPFQRRMVEFLGTDHHEVSVSRRDIAAVFPEVVFHTERPVLRTAPAPMYLLSRRVRESGIKVVLTGEGADEMFAGYDLFREARVRRFWARRPDSEWRPRLLERLYPYLQRSPVAGAAIARQFFGKALNRAHEPGFGHDVRWRGTAALKRLFSGDLGRAIEGISCTDDLVASLPSSFRRWSPLAQDQYVEVRTLLSGYLLSSQGDRMLMANSVEGRFPFLDRNVAALADSLPASYKLRVLAEKHVLKRAAEGLVPTEILARTKQPYRAPDALSFAERGASDWLDDVAGAGALKEAGVFDPRAAQQLIDKCRAQRSRGQFSNIDNMGIVAVASTQLVYAQLIRQRPPAYPPPVIRTVVDRLLMPAEAR
jgi:asparagine synthase (glutamine-hydrolysing)